MYQRPSAWLLASHGNVALLHVTHSSSVHVFVYGEWSRAVTVADMPSVVRQMELTDHGELIVGDDVEEHDIRVYPWRGDPPTASPVSWGPVKASYGHFALLPSRQVVCQEHQGSKVLLVYDLDSADPAATVQRVECDEVPGLPLAAIDERTVVCNYNHNLTKVVKLD